ncbi:MAG: DUF1611 domain-containing protein [Armatimonadetes bacterium]|nr:DUF1611 domain-containing protein [Armatimonadota bacterium]
MLTPLDKLAIYCEGGFEDKTAKMAVGVLRYSANEVTCLIDSRHAGEDSVPLTGVPRRVPIVATMEEARTLGANTAVLGIAPPGGHIPDAWRPILDQMVSLEFNIVNGLHERLALSFPGAMGWIWDVRQEPAGLGAATGMAREHDGIRLLTVGTDMSVGKMTAGLEILKEARVQGVDAAFVATGQIGIVVTGGGVPLDAVRVDYAAGSVEREVMRHAAKRLIVIEGQGSLGHPSSTAPLPLLRGSMPTHLVMCHRAGMEHLPRLPWVKVPPLQKAIQLVEDLAEAVCAFGRPRTVGVALNPGSMAREDAVNYARALEQELGIPVVDPLTDGVKRLVAALPLEPEADLPESD